MDRIAVDGQNKDKGLALAAAIEGDSEHMIVQGTRQAAQEIEA